MIETTLTVGAADPAAAGVMRARSGTGGAGGDSVTGLLRLPSIDAPACGFLPDDARVAARYAIHAQVPGAAAQPTNIDVTGGDMTASSVVTP